MIPWTTQTRKTCLLSHEAEVERLLQTTSDDQDFIEKDHAFIEEDENSTVIEDNYIPSVRSKNQQPEHQANTSKEDDALRRNSVSVPFITLVVIAAFADYRERQELIPPLVSYFEKDFLLVRPVADLMFKPNQKSGAACVDLFTKLNSS